MEKREKKEKKKKDQTCKSYALLMDVAKQLANVSKRKGKLILHSQVF